MIELYGITNCTTVKKARVWLAENQHDYQFHDFKKSPPSPDWRKLTPEQQAQAQTPDGAIELMCAYPSVIKRPILVHNQQILVGFSPEMYADAFQAA